MPGVLFAGAASCDASLCHYRRQSTPPNTAQYSRASTCNAVRPPHSDLPKRRRSYRCWPWPSKSACAGRSLATPVRPVTRIRARCPGANDFQRVVKAAGAPPGRYPRSPPAHCFAPSPHSNEPARSDRTQQSQHHRCARRLQPAAAFFALCQSQRPSPRPRNRSRSRALHHRPSASARSCQAGSARPTTR